MQTEAVAATATAAANPPKSQRAATSLSDNFDTFMTLLTAQLKNQDPLEPLDTHQFTQQLVQFSGVEQAISTNKNLETLISLSGTNALQQGVNFLGRQIEADQATAGLGDDGASWRYSFAEPVANATLTVSDADGKLVFATSAKGAVGRHSFEWDGKDAKGNVLPAGAYTLAVVGKNASGTTVQAGIGAVGRVTGVERRDNGTVLLMGGAEVALDKVRSVAEAGV